MVIHGIDLKENPGKPGFKLNAGLINWLIGSKVIDVSPRRATLMARNFSPCLIAVSNNFASLYVGRIAYRIRASAFF